MSRLELLTVEGLRIDGRRPNELRKITAKTSVLAQADGSAYIEQGNTKCLAAVYGPQEVRHRMQILHDRAIINVEFNVAPFSTSERKKRSKNDKRSLEIASAIKQTFEPVVQTSQFPRSQIDIYLQVLQHDGGTLQACINAATMALIDAGIPMIDYVCASTAGCIEKQPVLDLNYLEESSDSPELTVAILPRTGKVNLMSMESRLHVDMLESVAALATQGCEQIHTILDSVVRQNTQLLKDIYRSVIVKMQDTGEQEDVLRDRMLAHLERIKAQAQADHDVSDDDELFNQADANLTVAAAAETAEAETSEASSKGPAGPPAETADITMDTPKKKKKKKRKPKTAGLPEAGSTIPDDYVEKYNEDPELDIFNPARPVAQRVEFAMAKYRKNHKFSISKKNIFDDYLRFGGINTGPNAFQGRTTGADNPGDELAEDDYEAAKVGIDSIEDDDDDDVSVSFREVAQIYFGSRFIRQSKFIQLSEFQDAPEVVDAFLRYLQIRNVCPEYDEDIQAARDICDRARLELPRCKTLINLFPDKFNQACCVLFEGNQKDIMDFVPTWNTGDSKLQATYGSFLADTVGMTKDEALSIVSPIVGDADQRKVVNKKLVQRVRVVDIEGQQTNGANFGEETSEPVLLGSTSANTQHSIAGIYVKVTVSDFETSLTKYTLLMEKRNSDQMLPKLVFTADFYELDNGQWYIDQVNSIFPSFFLEEDEGSDEDV